MQTLGYFAALTLAAVLQSLPLRVVAGIGRLGGRLAWHLDRSHRHVALLNLSRCFPTMSEAERREIAREHFRRLGENYASAVKTAVMEPVALESHLEVHGLEQLDVTRGAVVAIGHFGNFELYARIAGQAGIRGATTYRGMKSPKIERLVRKLRERSGCLFFERRTDGAALRSALRTEKIVLGLLCDQHAGSRALRLPFLGHECSVNAAPAVLALRYGLPLHTAICYRVAPARWRVEFSTPIPTAVTGTDGIARRRSVPELMAEVHVAFEHAVRRDPANWFLVHDRWRFAKMRNTERATRSLARRKVGTTGGARR